MQRGFFASLFDTSFRSLITTRIIKVIYVLYMVVIALGAVVLIISGFVQSVGTGLVILLVAAPLGALLYLIMVRVFLEMVIALFRIMENTQTLVELGGSSAGASPPGAGAVGSVPAQTPPPAPPLT